MACVSVLGGVGKRRRFEMRLRTSFIPSWVNFLKLLPSLIVSLLTPHPQTWSCMSVFSTDLTLRP